MFILFVKKCFCPPKVQKNEALTLDLKTNKNWKPTWFTWLQLCVILHFFCSFQLLFRLYRALTSCRGHKSFEPIKEKIKLTPTLTQPITKLVWICVLYTKYSPFIEVESKQPPYLFLNFCEQVSSTVHYSTYIKIPMVVVNLGLSSIYLTSGITY